MPKRKTAIFQITVTNESEHGIFIGSTYENRLSMALAHIKAFYKKFLQRDRDPKLWQPSFYFFDKYNWDDIQISLIEYVECETRDECKKAVLRNIDKLETYQQINFLFPKQKEGKKEKVDYVTKLERENQELKIKYEQLYKRYISLIN